MTNVHVASLEVTNVSKRLGSALVLRNLTLTLGPGDVCGVVGSNGSGKSTLLRILSGQLSPDSGSVTICGYPLRQPQWLGSESDARRYASYVPDQNEALLELTGYEFLNLHRALRGIRSSPGDDAVEAALGLSEFAGRRLKVMSQGQRKRVYLAGSVAGDPPVWLLDEPTNALDAQTCDYLASLVVQRSETGLVTLAVTHDERALTQWKARIVAIEALQQR